MHYYVHITQGESTWLGVCLAKDPQPAAVSETMKAQQQATMREAICLWAAYKLGV